MDDQDIYNWNFDYETTVGYLEDSQTLLSVGHIKDAIKQLTACVASIHNPLEELKRNIDTKN